MRPNRRVFVVGGAHSTYIGKGHPDYIGKGHPDYGTAANPSLEEHMGRATQATFSKLEIDPADVDKAYVSNFLGECFASQGHLGAMLVRVEPRLSGKPIARVEAACASGSAAIAACVDAMQAGADVTFVAGVEVETNAGTRVGIDYMARAAHYAEERPLADFTFPTFFARRAKAYKEAYGATEEDIGRVVVKAYTQASRNPHAQMRTVRMDLDTAVRVTKHNALFLEDEALRPHIKLFDCTTFTDGASAVVLATEDGLAKLGVPMHACTEILSYGHTVRALGAKTNPVALENMQDAAQIAYRDAGVRPEEMEVVEVHDCFAINELLQYEALGLCQPGEAPRLLADGVTAIDGAIPVNTGGGLLGFGHPIGATGVKQIIEISDQMHGRCGDYQLAKRPALGVAANLGGDDRTGIVTVLRRCE